LLKRHRDFFEKGAFSRDIRRNGHPVLAHKKHSYREDTQVNQPFREKREKQKSN
jgi:hypothetical protein